MRSATTSGQAVFVGVLVATCLAAVGFSVWSLVAQARTEAALAGAVILLALAQLSAVLSRLTEEARRTRSNRDLVQAAADIGREVRDLRRRMSEFEERQPSAEDDSTTLLARQLSRLETTVAALADRLETAAASRPGSRAPAAHALPPRGNGHDADGLGSEVELYLQPIVRLASGQTAYYRASFEPAGSRGEARFIARVVAVLHHLEARSRAVGIFCTLGAAAFADARFLHRLVKFLRRNHDVAGKLVIEITQADLARLTQPGMQGLAWLAELGATFCLARASTEAPDLAALRELGFQFVDIDVAALPPHERDRHLALAAFAAEAERHEITLMAGPVRRRDDLLWLQPAASLGHGPHFARPRRVRADFGYGEERQAAAA